MSEQRAGVDGWSDPSAPAREWAERLAGGLARLAVGLGLRESADGVETEIYGLIENPVSLFWSHPNWPSAMSAVGPPVEVSLRLDWGRSAALRLVVDVTDHRVGLAGNWYRYLNYARAFVGASVDEARVRELCQSHLNGVSPESRSRMLHGVGYGAAGSRRSTLYFRKRLDQESRSRDVLERACIPEAEVERSGMTFCRAGPSE